MGAGSFEFDDAKLYKLGVFRVILFEDPLCVRVVFDCVDEPTLLFVRLALLATGVSAAVFCVFADSVVFPFKSVPELFVPVGVEDDFSAGFEAPYPLLARVESALSARAVIFSHRLFSDFVFSAASFNEGRYVRTFESCSEDIFWFCFTKSNEGEKSCQQSQTRMGSSGGNPCGMRKISENFLKKTEKQEKVVPNLFFKFTENHQVEFIGTWEEPTPIGPSKNENEILLKPVNKILLIVN